jgi:nucleotide-binding universal stress UspA family protein
MTENTHGTNESPRRIVVGVDGSENAGHAAYWAAGEAERRGTTLTIVHALRLPSLAAPPIEPTGYAERRRVEGRAVLDAAAADVRSRYPDLPLDLELSDLDPAHTLTEFSRDAELLVTGNRGHGGFTGMLLGSVSRKLAVHAQCALVVVHEEPSQDAANRVVLGVGPKHSPAAARYAFETARRHGAVLTIVRAWFPNVMSTGKAGIGAMYAGHPEADHRKAVEEAESAVELLRKEFPDVEVGITTYEGNAVPGLIAAARDARLLVVGAHRRRGPLSAGAGYAVDGVLAHCPTPVAVVPDH